MNFGIILDEYAAEDVLIREVLYPGFGVATEELSRIDGRWYSVKLDRDPERMHEATIQLRA